MISHNTHVWEVGVATRLQEMHVDDCTDTERKMSGCGLMFPVKLVSACFHPKCEVEKGT